MKFSIFNNPNTPLSPFTIRFRFLTIFFLTFFFIVISHSALFGEKKTITFWHFWKPEQIDPLLVKFQKEFPDIEVKREQLAWKDGRIKLIAALSGGVGPDLFELGSTWATRFAEDGVLLPVDDQVTPDKFVMLEPVTLSVKKGDTFQKEIYGFPWIVGPRALFFNKNLCKTGARVFANGPESLNDLFEIARFSHQPALKIYGFGMGNSAQADVQIKRFLPFCWSSNLRLFSEKGGERSCEFFSPPFKKVVSFYKELSLYSNQDSQEIMDQLFIEGKMALHLSGPWLIAKIKKENPELEFGVSLFPAGEGGVSRSFLGGEYLVVSKSSQLKPEALKLANFLTNPENATQFCKNIGFFFPAIKLENPPEGLNSQELTVFFNQIPTSVHPPTLSRWVEIQEIIMQTVHRVLLGEGVDLSFQKGEKDYQILLKKSKTQNQDPIQGLWVLLFLGGFFMVGSLFVKAAFLPQPTQIPPVESGL